MDKAGKAHWDASWSSLGPATPLDVDAKDLAHRVDRELGILFGHLFAPLDTRSCRLLEVGCARSATLPYFHRRFGFEVVGIDYSELGCALAEEGVRRATSAAQIVCADFFAPPPELVGSFDVVFSYGLVEHFTNTPRCVAALAAFLKPGGLLLTIIPNMRGTVGSLQRLVNKPVYDVHVPLDREQLERAHISAGLDIAHSSYFLSTNFGVLNLLGVPSSSVLGLLKKACVAALSRFSLLVWWLERLIGVTFPPTRTLSPYVVCAALARK